MKEMRFDVKCVKECLVEYGVVFSVRKWKSYGLREVVMVKDVGACEKLRVCEVHGIEDIMRFGELSGFKSNGEWWNKVKSFGAQDGWLYRVKIMEEASASSDRCSTCTHMECDGIDNMPCQSSEKYDWKEEASASSPAYSKDTCMVPCDERCQECSMIEAETPTSSHNFEWEAHMDCLLAPPQE